MHSPKVLIVDDDPNILVVLSANLSDKGFTVMTCDSGDKALKILEVDYEINAIITDLSMDKLSGEELFKKINQLYPYIPVIVLTGYGSIESAVRLVKDGAFDYIEKPSDNAQLIKVLNRAVKHNSLYQEVQFLRQELNKKNAFCNIVGKSRKMIEVFELIESVAGTDHNVLIAGASGTGKELVARAIHNRSNRRNKSFVPINCSAIPNALMESELFGYEAGAFTGAVNSKPGKFESADKGTIFLDEIGELDKNLQAKLLRVLEDKLVQRVGSNKNIQLDFRLLAATNRDLKKDVAADIFREDLYYRLNVINIQIPPLRERGEDILYLAEFFLKKYSTLGKKQVVEISPQVLTLLSNYNWPGNVRELENVIKRAVILCKGRKVVKSDLPPELITANRKNKYLYKDEEKKKIIEALRQAGGNKSKAAKIAGVNRRQLYRIINKHDINCDEFNL